MRDFFEKHYNLKVFAALVFYLILNKGIHIILNLLGVDFGLTNAGAFIRENVIKVLPVLCTAAVFGTIGIMKTAKLKTFAKSILSGVWIMIIAVLGTYCYLGGIRSNGTGFKSASEIFFFIMFLFAVGISEELLTRGTISELLLRKYGNTKRGIWLSIIVSSVIFGALHFTNMFDGQGLRSTLMQMLSVTFMGLMLNAVYVRHRNIYAVAFLHAALDFMTIFSNGMIKGESILAVHSTPSESKVFYVILAASTYLMATLVIMRPKKLEQIIGSRDQEAVVDEVVDESGNDSKKSSRFGKVMKTMGFIIGLIIAAVLINGGITLIVQSIIEALKLPLTEFQILNYSGTFGVMGDAIALTFFIWKKGYAKNADQSDGKRRPLNLRIILYAILAVAGLKILLSSALSLCFSQLLPTESHTSGYTIWFDFLLAIVIAPISEELLFRYGLYNLVSRKIGKRVALILTSIIFAAIHGYNISGFLEVLAASVVFTLIYERTGNVCYNIACHMACNAYANIANVLVHSGVPVFSDKNGYDIAHPVVIGVAIIICVMPLVWKLLKNRMANNKQLSEKQLSKREGLTSV